MMRNKLLVKGMSLALAGAMAFSLAACTSPASEQETTDKVAILDTDSLSGTMGVLADDYIGVLGFGYNTANLGIWDETGINEKAPVVDTGLLAAMSKVYTQDICEINNDYYENLRDDRFTGAIRIAKTKSYESFVTSAVTLKTERQLIDADNMTLAQCLSAQLLSDIEAGMSASDMLNKYGDYVITEAYTGGAAYFTYFLNDKSEGSLKEAVSIAGAVNEELGLTDGRALDDAAIAEISQRVSDFDEQNVVADGKTLLQFTEEYAGINAFFYGGTAKYVRKTKLYGAIKEIPTWIDNVRNGAYQMFVQANNGVAIWDILEASSDADVKAMGAKMKDEYSKRNGGLVSPTAQVLGARRVG